ALEPAYFDKTQDYPADHPEVDYFVTVQNVGVTQDENGNKVLLTEDLRNGNGRTIKSRYSTPNRVDKFEEPINAVFWIMKDDSLPPVLKINDPILATTFGATLATKRTTAERLKKGVDINKLVIEPYANPFRVYPLIDDYNNFKYLFEELGTDCYILNTGFFLDQKIPKEVTLGAIESIIDDTAEFQEFGHLTDIQYMVTEDFKPDFTDSSYVSLVDERMKMRGEFIREQAQKNALNVLPNEALKAILSLINES
ncbi:MAG: phosphoenolpyruvate carboxykinase, partial [Desemzia incerta]